MMWVGLGGVVLLIIATLWLVARMGRGQPPYVDEYDWQ